jgi:hypothetical protein
VQYYRPLTFLLCIVITGWQSERVSAQEIQDLTTVRLDYPVHFLAPDGSDLVSKSGDYRVEASDNVMRLIPKEGGESLLVQAEQAKNEVELSEDLAVGIPGETEEQADTYSVLLLLPPDKSLEAVGTYSGIRPRGLVDAVKKATNQVKQGVNQGVSAANQAALRAKQEADRKAREAAAAASQAAQRAAQAAAQKAKEAAMLAQQAALKAKQSAERFARVQACKITVGAIRAGRALAGILQALPVAKSRRDSMQTRIQQDPAFRDQLQRQIAEHLKPYEFAIAEMKRIAAYLNNPGNRRAMESIFSPENFCQDSVAETDKKLIQLGLIPSFAAVRTRGAEDSHFYMGYQVTIGLGAVVAGQIGISGVTDFRGNGGKYWFIGPGAVTNASVDLTGQVSFFPKVALEDFSGWGWGIGVSGGPPSKIVSGAVDVSFNQTFPGFQGSQFQGFALGGGVGLGAIPGDVGVSYAHSWKY